MSFTWIRVDQLRQGAGWDRLSGRLPPHPPWVMKWAIVAAMLVFFVPLVILTLAALATFFLVFLGMALIAKVGSWFSGPRRPSADDGRRNVRVVNPADSAGDFPGAG